MDRAKLAVYLVGLFGLATVGQAAGLASMAGFEPQLSVFFGSGIATSGVAVHTLKTGRYEEFDLFRRREVAFWAVAVSVGAYIAAVSLQFP